MSASLPALAQVQRTSANNDLDGTAPTGAATTADRVAVYPEEDAGGLFSFASHLTFVDEIRVALVGGTDYTVEIVDPSGAAYSIASGTGLSNVAAVHLGPWRLTKGQQIKVTTTGAAGGNKARAEVVHRLWERVSGY